MCTHVGSMEELKGDSAAIEHTKFDWKQFGSRLGLSAAQMEELPQDVGGDNNSMEAVLRSVSIRGHTSL